MVFATKAVKKELELFPLPSQVAFHEVDEFIAMDDNPLLSVRQKKNSSLVVAMRLLKQKKLDAFVSAGNTGALIAAAALFMPMLPNVKRPALLAVLPTLGGPLTVIDVGGNVTSKASHLVQFAKLGASHHCRITKQANARVGLLNIGVESKKGTAELRRAYAALKSDFEAGLSPGIDFVGNVEARDVFGGSLDVLVTDGFTGNVLLKTSEGVSSFIFDYIRQHSPEPLKESANALQSIFNHAEYPGAIVCGIKGIVVKCHGSATDISLFNAIQGATNLASS